MKKSFMITALICVMGYSFPVFAKVGYVYNSQHNTVVYNTSKKAVGWNTVATLDFYKTVTKEEEAYYHIMTRLNGPKSDSKSKETAILIIDNSMYDVYPTPINKFDTIIGRDRRMLILDYEIPHSLVEKLKNCSSLIGLQVFVEGAKPRILTLDKNGCKDVQMIINLKHSDYDAVKKGKIKPEYLQSGDNSSQ